MRHLVIVGAGVAGSCAQRIASFYGWRTTVIDPVPSSAASRAALATIRPQWLGDNGREWAKASWRWYERWGANITQHGLVSSWKKPEPVLQKDWWLVEPIGLLVEPDIRQTVVNVTGTTVTTSDEQTFVGDAVLIAVGAYDRNLYDNFKPMAGCTLYNDEIEMMGAPLRVHHLRPFHALTVAQQAGTVVLGSSIHREMGKAEEEVWRMLTVAEDIGIVPKSDAWTMKGNTRATSPAPQLPVLGNPSTTIGSLSRSGYGITPHVVEQWILSLS
jgi:glycine/D-amino acid oxidase-like deaminating enzyme